MGNKVKGIRKFGSANEPKKHKGYKLPDISYREQRFRSTGLTSSFDSVEDLRAAKAVSETAPHTYYDLPSRSDQAGDAIVEAMNRARARDNERHKVNGSTLPKYMSQAYVDNLDTNKDELAGKGEKGQRCNRTACQAPGAYWYNHSTHKYYCGTCADLINDANKGDSYVRDLGHPLLTLDPDFFDKLDDRL